MIRFGLCCVFLDQPIRFRATTASALLRLPPAKRRSKLTDIIQHNAQALQSAIHYCGTVGIGAFRVNSQILPLKTHPQVGYETSALPAAVITTFRNCKKLAKRHNVRLSFHPDQFVVLNSPKSAVVENSMAELEYQAEVAEWIGADVINIHAGGAYGDKRSALEALESNLPRLSGRVLQRLTLENDDRTYTPTDLLPLCKRTTIPLVYDVHHHRCNPGKLSIKAATMASLETWNREPLFHISSPREGWKGPDPRRHHDYIHLKDFPRCWESLDLTVEVEAKAKERAVLRLARGLSRRTNGSHGKAATVAPCP